MNTDELEKWFQEGNEYPVIWKNKQYCGIKEFDCINIALYTEPTKQSGYFTSLSISGTEFRGESPTKAMVKISKGITADEDWTHFFITDDWGEHHVMSIHKSLSDYIDAAIASAKKHEIPMRPRPLIEQLTILREYAPEYIASEGSLCMSIGLLWGNNILDQAELWELMQYLLKNKPADLLDIDGRWWPKGEVAPRLEFLDGLVTKLTTEEI